MKAYPRDFLWGASTAAYQVEGGFNLSTPGSPRNNWATWEEAGRVERTGQGCRFWELWPDDLDRARGIGLNAFRLGLEWARLEPREGRWDAAAVAGYAAIIAGCRQRGMRPVVTLHHFSHPEWLGSDPWLDEAAPIRFASYCAQAVTRLGRALGDLYGQAPVDFWVTVNEPNALATATYRLKAFPKSPARGGRRDWATALTTLMRAHVHGYRSIHDAYLGEGWPAPVVTYNAWAGAAYGHDRRWLDALRPETRWRRTELRRQWYAALPQAGLLDWTVHQLIDRMLPDAAVQTLVDELSADEDPLDVISLDFYDPYIANYMMSWRGPRRHPWEWLDRSAIMASFLRAYMAPHQDKSLYILEHGVAVSHEALLADGSHRRDRRRRGDVIADAALALDDLVGDDDGPVIGGYFHWSLMDNYEWGSFKPRFGLFAVDVANGAARSDLDAQGEDAAGRYAAVIRERAAR